MLWRSADDDIAGWRIVCYQNFSSAWRTQPGRAVNSTEVYVIRISAQLGELNQGGAVNSNSSTLYLLHIGGLVCVKVLHPTYNYIL